MADVLETLEKNVTARRLEKLTEKSGKFLGLVAQIAAGESPSPDDVDQVLTECGKELGDLKAAVAVHKQRQKWREKIDQAEAGKGELPELNAKIAAAREELEAAKAKFNETTKPLFEKREEIEKQQLQATASHRQLMQSCPDESLALREVELQEQLRELNAEISTAFTRVNHLEKKAAEMRDDLQAYRNWNAGHRPNRHLSETARRPPPNYVGDAEYQAEIRKTDAQLKKAGEELEAVRKRKSDIEAQLTAINAKKLDP